MAFGDPHLKGLGIGDAGVSGFRVQEEKGSGSRVEVGCTAVGRMQGESVEGGERAR